MQDNLPEELLRRAKDYLKASEILLERGLYEPSALASEVSAQLSLNGLIFKLGLDPPRTHGVRKLLATIYAKLKEEKIVRFVEGNKDRLVLLENLRRRSQCDLPPVSKGEAETALIMAREVLKLVESLWDL